MRKIQEIKRNWLTLQIKSLCNLGLSKAEISRQLNILPQQLNNILNGNRGVSDKFLDSFIEKFKKEIPGINSHIFD